MSRTRYCCGFAFDTDDLNYVYLIEKKRPEWQEGLLNGVGGHIETEETPRQAMVREFKEETGISTFESDWTYFCYLVDTSFKWEVYFFVSHIRHPAHSVGKTDEKVERFLVSELHELPVISNLHWLIPLALYPLNTHVVVQERNDG